MSWIVYVGLTACFFGLSLEHKTLFEEGGLYSLGYHLCTKNEIRSTVKVTSYTVSYSERTSCGGWLPWKMCRRTRYKVVYREVLLQDTKEVVNCCDGYEQVGSYCALPLNRSREFTAKPGHCPSAEDGHLGVQCEWDIDCPGWQKCCKDGDNFRCANAVAAERRWFLNVTLVVKTNFQELSSMDKGILNHTRLLHSVVTGALDSPGISVFHIQSCWASPLSTASTLLIGAMQTLSLHNSSQKLQLLLENIKEVSSLEVQDVDECAHVELNSCPPEANCLNIEGTYTCPCRPGFIKVMHNNTGVCSQANGNIPQQGNRTEMPHDHVGGDNVTSYTHLPPNTTTYWLPLMGTLEDTTMHLSNGTVPSIAALEGTPHNGTNVPHTSDPRSVSSTQKADVTHTNWSVTLAAPHSNFSSSALASSSTEPPMNTTKNTLTSTCYVAPVTGVYVTQITGSTFTVNWTAHSTYRHTFQVLLLQGPQVLRTLETEISVWEVTDLEPGVQYTFRIIPFTCNNQGVPHDLNITTAAKILRATFHLNNVVFKEDFLNSSSQDYLDFIQDIEREIRASLLEDILALLTSGAIKLKILSLTSGSVVVNSIIVFSPDVSQDIRNVSLALIESLEKSSIFTVDSSSSGVYDYDECSSMETVCSPLAVCENNWGSYTCTCREGFINRSLDNSGTSCEAVTIAVAPSEPLQNTTVSFTMASSHEVPHSNKTTEPLHEDTDRPTAALVLSFTEAITVECRASEISVAVVREFLKEKHIAETSLYLGQPDCGVSGRNVTHVQLVTTWDKCNTQLLHNSTHNTAQITLYSDGTSSNLFVPKVHLEVPVLCTYRNSILISTGYNPAGFDMIRDVVEGSGTFHVTFQLLNGSTPLSQNYSLSPNEDVTVEASINSTLPQIRLIIDQCWATPTSDPSDPKGSLFMDKSCPVPGTFTTVLQNGNSSISRLTLRIFSFVEQNVIYLHCQIQICIETDMATCTPECMGRRERSANVVGTGKASCGPIFKSQDGSTTVNVGSLRDVGFIIFGVGLCLLLIGAIAAAFYYRRRIGRYNFRFTTKQENFTYHVFGT